MWGTVMEGNLVNPAYVHADIVSENHADAGVAPIPEDHVDAGTVLVLENQVDEVTLIPENHVEDEIVHVCTGMLTGVPIPKRSDVPTT